MIKKKTNIKFIFIYHRKRMNKHAMEATGTGWKAVDFMHL